MNLEKSNPDPDYVPESKKSRVSRDTKSKQNAVDVLTEHVISALDRNKVSNRQALKIITPVAAALVRKSQKLRLSYSTIRRRRLQHRRKIAERVAEEFNPAGPMVVHWDGVKLENISNSSHSERVAILVSWDGNDKLLGTVTLEHATGNFFSHLTFKTLTNHLNNKVKKNQTQSTLN